MATAVSMICSEITWSPLEQLLHPHLENCARTAATHLVDEGVHDVVCRHAMVTLEIDQYAANPKLRLPAALRGHRLHAAYHGGLLVMALVGAQLHHARRRKSLHATNSLRIQPGICHALTEGTHNSS